MTDHYTLKNGFGMRYSKEIGGDKNTNHKMVEWPSDEFLGEMSAEQFQNFKIDKIMWAKGTHFGAAEDFCNSLRFVSNTKEESPLFSDKKPDDEIDVSNLRIANILAKTNYHHVFCYKFLDDFEEVLGKPIYSKYDSKGEDETKVRIALDEKLVGFKIQLSDWTDCKISKISFKIAKCPQPGINIDDIAEKKKAKIVKDELLDIKVEVLISKKELASKYQCYFIKKHDGEEFIQHNKKDGTYEAYKLGTDDKVDSGKWTIKETTYYEKDGNWKGKFKILENDNFAIDFYAGEHGYHEYRPTSDEYIKGLSTKDAEMKKEVESLPFRGNSWCEINYADFCSGDLKNESCHTYQ